MMKYTYNKKFICSKCGESERITWSITKRPTIGDDRMHVSVVCDGTECDNRPPQALSLPRGSFDFTLPKPMYQTTYHQWPHSTQDIDS